MEQSIITLEAQRWANAIVKLTSLTYSNKLMWVKRLSAQDDADAFPGTRLTSTRYNADFEGQRFLLTVSAPSLTSASSWSELMGMPGYGSRSTVSLQVFDRHGARIIDVPSLSVLQPLADAVQSQADSREEFVLSAIEKAEA